MPAGVPPRVRGTSAQCGSLAIETKVGVDSGVVEGCFEEKQEVFLRE